MTITDPLPPALNTDYLTAAFHRAGVASGVRVLRIDVDSVRPTIMSQIIRLRLTYDVVTPNAPASVILKMAHPERRMSHWTGGQHEVAFYRDVAADMARQFVPRCFDAHCDPAAGEWHLVLEDLTETHATLPSWPLPPSAADCARILTTRARFHAAWWDDKRLGLSVGTVLQGAERDRAFQCLADRFTRFVDRFGDHLSSDRRHLIERYLAAAPELSRQNGAHRHLTVMHGDAHVWNCFLPRDGSDDVRLFDWDAWRIGSGADDLAYMMAMHWYPDRRHRLEAPLLDGYHDGLLAHGVSGYDRAALALDYRLATLRMVMWPVWQAILDVPPVIWWNNLERILLAVHDLGCRELLG